MSNCHVYVYFFCVCAIQQGVGQQSFHVWFGNICFNPRYRTHTKNVVAGSFIWIRARVQSFLDKFYIRVGKGTKSTRCESLYNHPLISLATNLCFKFFQSSEPPSPPFQVSTFFNILHVSRKVLSSPYGWAHPNLACSPSTVLLRLSCKCSCVET